MTKTVWLWIAAMGVPAAADDVILKNGQKLEGVIREDGDRVTVEVPGGSITIDLKEVKSFNRPSEKLSDEYDRRLQSLNGEGASGTYDLALWARQQGMEARAQALYRRALEIDPDHEGARKALGFRSYKGTWLTEDPYMTAALGLARHNGQWLPVETVAELRKAEHELQVAQVKQAAETQRAEQEFRVELMRAAAVRENLNYAREEKILNRVPTVQMPWGLRYWGPAAARE